MKQRLAKLLSILLIASLLLSFCSCIMTPDEQPDDEQPVTFTLTYSANEGGHIVGQAVQTVEKGKNATSVTAVADEGYKFEKWSDGQENSVRHDLDVQQDISVTALFAKVSPSPVYYKVKYVATSGGYIVGDLMQSVEQGQNAKAVIAVADEGYKFEKWSDGLTSATRQDRNVQQDISVTALFAKIGQPTVFYTVTYVATSGGYIVGNSVQTVEQGQNTEAVTAVADDGYTFEKWSDGLTSATRQDCNVQESVTLTAIFTEIPAPKTVTFELDYKYGVVANPIDNVTFVEDEVSATVLPVPTRERFTFGGWYVGEMQVTDNNGAILVGNEILDSNETVIYAKWTANETHTFKVLMIYVTSVQARLHSKSGSWVDVNYTMSDEEKVFCHATTKRLSSYCYDMLDGLVDFQFDEYFTTETMTTDNIQQAPSVNGSYSTHLFAYNITEVRALLTKYDSCIVVYGLNPTISRENLFFDYNGTSGPSYAEVCLDSVYNHFFAYDITLEQMTESMTNCTEIERYGMVNMVFNTWLCTIIHEMAHTIELRFGRDTLHEGLGTTTFVTYPIKMKEFYLNELLKNGQQYGIPYDVWARNFARVTLSVNDKEYGSVKFNRYFSEGTLIDPANNLTDRYYEAFIGEEISISAKTYSGYKLARWSDGNTDLTRTITITEDLSLTAMFELAEYTITVCPSEGGRVSGYFEENGNSVAINNKTLTGIVRKGSSKMYVSASPNDGYRFVGWSNGETNRTLDFTFNPNSYFPVDLFDDTYTLILIPIFEKIE